MSWNAGSSSILGSSAMRRRADLALFAYTHRADEGGFDLARWPGVTAWLARLASRPGIVLLPRP